MRVQDLFEADIIPFPSRKPMPEPKMARRDSTANENVLAALRDQVKQSIIRQKKYALPTIMRDQPRAIKPAVAWAIALDEVSHIKNKNQIQQWIYDTGKTIVDDLLVLIRQDIQAYQDLYKMKMEPWQTGKTAAVIYRHKQVDRNAEDMLEKFKKEQVLSAA